MPGDYLSILLIAYLLTIPLAWVLARWYKSYVEKRINSSGGEAIQEALSIEKNTELPFPGIERIEPKPNSLNPSYQLKYLLPYIIAGLMAGFALHLVSFWLEDRWPTKIFSFIVLGYLCCLPVWMVVYLFFKHTYHTKRKVILFMVLSLVLVLIYSTFRTQTGIFTTAWALLSMYGQIPIFLLLIRLIPAIRQILFTIYPAVLMSVLAGVIIMKTFSQDDKILALFFHPLYDSLQAIGLENQITSIFILLILLFLFSSFYVIARFIRWAYTKKRYNYFMFMTDEIWLLQMVYYSLSWDEQNGLWMGLLLFVFYKVLLITFFRFFKVEDTSFRSKNLLVLRVFALGNESASLYDRLKNYWQFKGPIRLIAGHDLNYSTLDIDDLIEWQLNGLKYRFNTSATRLQENLKKMDLLPDKDGSYRTSEMYCTNVTWKMVLKALLKDTDVVFMDLRRFSKTNQGCAHEIIALIHEVDLSKICFVVDQRTDLKLFENVAREAWSNNLPLDSPNRLNKNTPISYFRYDGAKDSDALWHHLENISRDITASNSR